MKILALLLIFPACITVSRYPGKECFTVLGSQGELLCKSFTLSENGNSAVLQGCAMSEHPIPDVLQASNVVAVECERPR